MATRSSDDVLRFIADHLEVEQDDLALLEANEGSVTFRQTSTGRVHTADVEVGPEGPVVTIRA